MWSMAQTFLPAIWMLLWPLIRYHMYYCLESSVDAGVPVFLVRVLWSWYRRQLVCVKWGSEYSNNFLVHNGVRQGGILSPLLYNFYVNEMSANLNKISAGCCINNVLINHLMYADDVVLMAPSAKGLQKLIDECFAYRTAHNIKFNCLKTV